jgi:hypothetical protein
MTARGWLLAQARRARRATVAASGLSVVAPAAVVLSAGVAVDALGGFRRLPELVVAPWLLALGAALAVVWWRRAAMRATSAAGVGAAAERLGGLRTGALAGLADVTHGSPALADLADRRMRAWLDTHGDGIARALRQGTRRGVARQVTAAGAGMVLLAAAGAARPESAVWRPVDTVRAARAPVLLRVDRTSAARGDSIVVTVEAQGRDAAVLHLRRAGESWTATDLPLAAGHATTAVGPIVADVELVAGSGRRVSDTVRVALRPSLFLAELTVTARYPAYLDRPPEPVPVTGDTVLLPVGTVLDTRARASLPLVRAAWISDTQRVPLPVVGTAAGGRLPIARSATWRLDVEAEDALPWDEVPPTLTVTAVPDAAPSVTLIVPAADTVMPTTLLQALVIEVQDDHRVARVEVLSRRLSRLGVAGPVTAEAVPLPPEGLERGVLAAQLDLNGRGFLPGDTAYVRVRVTDNAPRPRAAETAEVRLRLPSLGELREAVRQESRAIAAAADSLAGAQRDVTRAVEDLARQRQRQDEPSRGEGRAAMDFTQTERAAALGTEQREVLERAAELRDRLAALDRTAWDAGLTDPALHEQLAELRRLLDRALTPELEAALRDLERALDRLDPASMRAALEQLAETQRALREELERSRSLFERAALEGDLTTLADDAADLAAEQQAWNRAVQEGVDSILARAEARLADRADSLAGRLADTERAVAEAGGDTTGSAAAGARAAAGHMERAAEAAAGGQQREAAAAGARASERLDPLAAALTSQRDVLRDLWRTEVTAALDAALTETARLADAQEDVVRRLERGETGAAVRGAQGAVREGLDRVLERVQTASGRNALVGPSLGISLGYARNRMGEALGQLAQGAPNARAAADAAGEALDGLNLLAMQLLRSSGDVAGAQSGSGLAEAVERMAELAEQQGRMAGQSGGMLPLMQSAGQALLQELQTLARQQRALAAELHRLQAQGDQPGAGELATEAETIARALERGALTRETVERQERLYRRLLDAGRLLRGPEADDEQERRATTATPGSALRPSGERPRDAGPRYRFPTWEELQGLSPADRRAVLDYFRTLNDARRQ